MNILELLLRKLYRPQFPVYREEAQDIGTEQMPTPRMAQMAEQLTGMRPVPNIATVTPEDASAVVPDWAIEFAMKLRDKMQGERDQLGASQSNAIPLVQSHAPMADQLIAQSTAQVPMEVFPSGTGFPPPPPDDVRFDLPGGSITIPGGEQGLRRLRAQAQEWMKRAGQSDPLSKRTGVINEPDPNHRDWTIISQEIPLSRPDIDDAQRASLELEIVRQALGKLRRESENEPVKQVKASDYATLQRQARFNAMLAINGNVPEAQAIAQISPTIERMNDMADELGMPRYSAEDFYRGVKNNMAREDPLADFIGAIGGATGGRQVSQEQNIKNILGRLDLQ